MPDPMTPARIAALVLAFAACADVHAPRGASTAGSGSDDPPALSTESSWAAIHAALIAPRCTDCHRPDPAGTTPGNLWLPPEACGSYRNMVDDLTRPCGAPWIVPGTNDTLLVAVLSGEVVCGAGIFDHSGILSADELELLRDWIAARQPRDPAVRDEALLLNEADSAVCDCFSWRVPACDGTIAYRSKCETYIDEDGRKLSYRQFAALLDECPLKRTLPESDRVQLECARVAWCD